MRRALVTAAVLLVAGFAALQAAPVIQNAIAPAPASAPAPKPAAPPPPISKSVTPMAQRVATIGLLNKRNGLWRDLTMKPGEAIRVGDVVVRLRACEKTAPWESERYTGAFVQVITRQREDRWFKTFSGWLYKESPSLNVVEHPVYDVWVKECTMRHPDTGPDTIVAKGDESGGGGSSGRRSRAPQSASDQEAVGDVPEESDDPSITE